MVAKSDTPAQESKDDEDRVFPLESLLCVLHPDLEQSSPAFWLLSDDFASPAFIVVEVFA